MSTPKTALGRDKTNVFFLSPVWVEDISLLHQQSPSAGERGAQHPLSLQPTEPIRSLPDFFIAHQTNENLFFLEENLDQLFIGQLTFDETFALQRRREESTSSEGERTHGSPFEQSGNICQPKLRVGSE